ncbi:MAG: hypothetical protein ACREQF_02215 [Candidatus Binataceae bacterium]
MSTTSFDGVLRAAADPDWEQVRLNGGPPCFHVEHDRKFCLRAKRWAGHEIGSDHSYVSLQDLLSYWGQL